MATWEIQHWESSLDSGVPAADRRSGPYMSYLPDPLDGAGISVKGDLARRIAVVERRIRSLNGPGTEGLSGIARFLLRSEAIASSRIEGIAPSAQQVALAELGQAESVRGVSDQARHVANNMTAVRRATAELVTADELDVQHIVDVHTSLLPEEPRFHDLRRVQNWIGTSAWSPIGADFVPPDPAHVPRLMQDLVDHINGAALSPIVQAALVHAQFETIHPFTDGNGRVGRALIHTVLARRGLADRAVLPISLVLATLSREYVAGLTDYRHGAPTGSDAAAHAINEWLAVFVAATEVAIDHSEHLATRIEELRERWESRLAEHRSAQGIRATPRANSATARLLLDLPEAPVVTAHTLARILGISYPAAHSALDELKAAGILHTRSIERGTQAYIAREILDLVTFSERALASTRFDTRVAAPSRDVPARPQR